MAICLQDEFRAVVHRAMAGRNHGDFIPLNLGQILLDDLAEGHHDFGIVALGSLIGSPLVRGIQIGGGGGQVRAQKGAGKQDPVLAQIGEHGFRPVDPGRVDEFQSPIPQRQRCTIINGQKSIGGHQEQVHEHLLALGRANDLCLGILCENLGQRARMVLFRVVGDDIVEPLQAQFAQMVKQDVGLGRVYSIHKSCLFAALD